MGMKREDCLRELALSMAIGNVITIILFAIVHQRFGARDAVAFLIGTWAIATYAVWTISDIVDRKKGRNGWSRHDRM